MAIGSVTLNGPRVPPRRGSATHLVVLCHGYGANGEDLIGLAPHWQQVMPTAAFVSPNAPQPVPGAPGGYQWFPISRLEPDELARGVEAASSTLDAFIDAELARLSLPPERLALIGFSQGTMMSLHVGLRRAIKPFVIVGYSGLLAGDAPALGDDAPPILLVHGDADPMIPPAALFASAAALGRAGATVQWHVSPGTGHGIDETGLVLGGEFLGNAAAGRIKRPAGSVSCPFD